MEKMGNSRDRALRYDHIIILIGFLLFFTFVESLRPDFLTDDWNKLGIYYALIAAAAVWLQV